MNEFNVKKARIVLKRLGTSDEKKYLMRPPLASSPGDSFNFILKQFREITLNLENWLLAKLLPSDEAAIYLDAC